MYYKSRIAQLMYSIFDEDAIKAVIIAEQLEDVRYCIKHKMSPGYGPEQLAKREAMWKKGEYYAQKSKTYTDENIIKFRKSVNEYLHDNPSARLYDDLSETEHFAVRGFYYPNN